MLIDESDTRTLQKIYDDADQSNHETVPWVRVGNLYLSVTETGNLTWPPIILHLHKNGHRNFRVFSGRHGSPGGGFRLDGVISKKVADPAHFTEDKDVVLYLTTGKKEGLLKNETPSSHFGGKSINITAEDFGTGSRDKLKDSAKTYLDKGDTVIFAWCFSVASMYLYNDEKSDLETASYKNTFNKSVKTVVGEKFDWVKRFINAKY